jgi:two-component system, chemotaxis family, CheB/CheR fusion protein
MRVVAWSQKSEFLWGLSSTEAQNQHFLNLDIGLPVKELTKPIQQVMSDQESKEELILSAHNRRGKEITCRVVITPLKPSKENMNGVILIIEGTGGLPSEVEQMQLEHEKGLMDGQDGG